MTSNSLDDMFFFFDETLMIDEDKDVSKTLIECNQCICCTQNEYCVY